MKTAISIPDDLFNEADALAHRTGKSRSQVYADALRDHLQRQKNSSVTERLDAVYSDSDVEVDGRWLAAVAAGVASRSEW